MGNPSQVNLAFDAEQLRLAMIWKGKFADPSGVWRGQASGTVRPLSRDVIRFAPDHLMTPAIPGSLMTGGHRNINSGATIWTVCNDLHSLTVLIKSV